MGRRRRCSSVTLSAQICALLPPVWPRPPCRRPTLNATLRGAAGWLFFRVARSLSINLDMLVATPPISLLSAICHFRASGGNNCTVFSTVQSFWSNTDSPGFVMLTQFRGGEAFLMENDQQTRLLGRQQDFLLLWL